MNDIPPLDSFHAHEVLHTASIVAALFEERIELHPFTQADEDLKLEAARLSAQLHDFYQLVGNRLP
jgi:hypothetical protein